MEYILGSPIASFTDLLLDAVCMVDAHGTFRFVSIACERIFGYTQAEMIGRNVIDLVAPHDRQRTLAAGAAVMAGHTYTHFQNQYVRKDGTLVDIMWSARWSAQDQMRVAIAREITVLKRAEAKQAALYAISEAAHATDDLPTLFDRSRDIIGTLLPLASFSIALHGASGCALQYDFHTEPTHSNDAHAALVRTLCAQVSSSEAPLLLAPGQDHFTPAPRTPTDAMAGSALAVPLMAAGRAIGVLVLRSIDSACYTSGDCDLLAFVSNQLAAAIDRKQLQAQMLFMAMHDELTRLPNRRLFHDRLATAFTRAQRQQGQFALMFIDLNRFKQVNDQHGHACGDRLLQEAARRIRECLRESDTFARIGGDEFVVLLEHIVLPTDTALVTDKIHAALAAPMHVGADQPLTMSVSIGLAMYPEHGADTKALMAHADQAMYAAKTAAAAATV